MEIDMTREEAIRRIKSWNLDSDDMEVLSSVIPELAESENEKIKEDIVNIILWLKTNKNLCSQYYHDRYDGMLAYLEKQKNPSFVYDTHDYVSAKKQGWEQYSKKNFSDNQSKSAFEKGFEAGYMFGIHEEKPFVWTKHDEAVREEAIACLEDWKGVIPVGGFVDYKNILAWLKEELPEKQKEQKPIKMEAYEIGQGTTICGQDYKCKKDYKEGNCWYIKDVTYHCSRDGYLNDQNGVSWSCTPEWFNEYIYTNSEWADKEKNDFVSGQFLQCKLSFDGFKEGKHYWIEYVGDDMYVGRSDNILNQKFHITPRQLFTLFSQELEEVQGPPQEEKQVSLNYEPPFDKNPSDREIIEALIHHLNEQDGFLTAIDCVSTKAILSWLKKQKEQKSEWNEEDEIYLQDALWCVKQASKVARDENDMGACWSAERWLKSLKNRGNFPKSNTNSPSWKPSKEQMRCLQAVVQDVNKKSLMSTTGYSPAAVLQSLYIDLKALM